MAFNLEFFIKGARAAAMSKDPVRAAQQLLKGVVSDPTTD